MSYRIHTFVTVVLILLAVGNRAQSQSTFINLDFEAASVADLPQGQGEFVAVSNGVPGWSVYAGDGQTMGHNTVSLGGAMVAILGPQWQSNQILQGSYTVFLLGSFSGPPVAVAIGQSGQLPSTAKSLLFLTRPTDLIQASFAGQPISLAQISSSGNYVTMGGDISAFAGQTGELRFTGQANGGGLLDNIIFSTQAVPEPNVACFYALGVLLLISRFRRSG